MAPRPRAMMVSQGTLKDAPDVAIALGELTARWSLLEHLLTNIFVRLTDSTYETASGVLYAVNATSARLDIIRTLAERLPTSDPRRADALTAVAAAQRLCARRNAYVHHTWVVEFLTNKVFTFDYRAEPDTQARRKSHSARAILLFCDEISDAYGPVSAAGGTRFSDDELARFKIPITRFRARKSTKAVPPSSGSTS